MFGFLKKMLPRKPAADVLEDQGQAEYETSTPHASPRSPSFPSQSVPKNPIQSRGRGIELPLQSILTGLPLELQPRVLRTEAGQISICVPLERILAQLQAGIVKITFGELRQAAPGFFAMDPDRDRVPVPLPLAEILARLNPALIARRRAQRQVEVPAEVCSPFDNGSQNIVFSASTQKPEEPQLTPPPRKIGPAPVRSALVRASIASVPGPLPPAMPPATMPPAATPPIAMTPLAMPLSPPAWSRPAPLSAKLPISIKPPTHAPAPVPSITPVNRLSAAAAAPLPQSARHPLSSGLKLASDSNERQPRDAQPPAPEPTEPAAETEALSVGITVLAESWPEPIRKEIVGLKLVDAQVALPLNLVERALKQGRIAFSWKTLRSWIKPLPAPSVSVHDSTVLELPLKAVAPLFLARQRVAGQAQHKVAVDEDIPNLFFGFPQAESNPVAALAPTDTNYYVWDDAADTVQSDDTAFKRNPSPGTRFVAKYATPNEIVSRAAALDNVAGALIALPDGLMVASRLSPDHNPDTLAAFLPQIFGKVSQSTKELRMGELNNLNFTVGNVPWKIFRVNAIFFAAFGHAGRGLPTAQLAALAAELDHKPK